MRLERAPARVGIAIIPGVTTSSCNPRRIGFPIYSTFQLQIEYSILSGTFDTNYSAGQEKLETSNSILILF
jgi:hypothetical protein